MNAPTTFYSASAGSGKTFTLARDYLTRLFESATHHAYRSILAVTFTNKAVAEMKERVMEYLFEFTKEEIPESIIAVAMHIKEKTGLDDAAFRLKAQNIHNRLLHDYSAFDIVTIDAFNHRILRTFSRDLKLPDGFEVELDVSNLIAKAVHKVIARAGEDKELTDLLISFSLFKINEGKSWDIEYDLMKVGELIAQENHFEHLERLKSKTPKDFKSLQKALQKDIEELQDNLSTAATHLLEKAASLNLSITDFKRGKTGPFSLVVKTAQGDLSVKPNAGSVKGLLTSDLYTAKVDNATKAAIEEMEGDLSAFAKAYQENWGMLSFKQDVIKNLVPLSVLNEIYQEIENIKNEEKIVPIYEFNGLLAREVKNQPAPFIYERLGERYKHFFIDEFQDTSTMQWENMEPLVSNALQQETTSGNRGSLMLVGDAKQSIYRWRGGDLDQFLKLLNVPQLFMLEKKQESLGFNWRSYDNIINFNNSYFEFYSDYLENGAYQELYQKHLKQENRKKPGGYIQIDFLDKANFQDDEDAGIYPTHVHDLVLQAQGNGFSPGEICILVRTNKQGNEIANYLISQQISVVSGDSLLVQHSLKVQVLASLMKLLNNPEQQELKFDFLLAHARFSAEENVAVFVEKHKDLSLDDVMKEICGEEVDGVSAFAKASLFQSAELLFHKLGLSQHPDTRLQTFLNLIHEFEMGKDASLSAFLEYWEVKRSSLSVPAMHDKDAVQIMTIHKSKGLEFPVVIAPHVDNPLMDTKRDQAWVSVSDQEFHGFNEVLIPVKQDLALYPDPLPEVYDIHAQKSQMDHINLLYVAFTRCREQLYIACKEKPEPKNGSSTPSQSQLLKRFVMAQDFKSDSTEGYVRFSTGSEERKSFSKEEQAAQVITDQIRSNESKQIEVSTKKGMLWATGRDTSIASGNRLHYYLSLVKYADDIPAVFDIIEKESDLNSDEKQSFTDKVTGLVTHKKTRAFFNSNADVFTEKALLLNDGSKQIIDRLHLDHGKITIIDFKTGEQREEHVYQVQRYQKTLEEIGYNEFKTYLIYTDNIEVVAIS